jgi:hypothetical protein
VRIESAVFPRSGDANNEIHANIGRLEGTQMRVVDFAAYQPRTVIYRDTATFAAYIALLACKPKHAVALLALSQGFLRSFNQNWKFGPLCLFFINAMLVIGYEGPQQLSLVARTSESSGYSRLGWTPGSWLGKILVELRGEAPSFMLSLNRRPFTSMQSKNFFHQFRIPQGILR